RFSALDMMHTSSSRSFHCLCGCRVRHLRGGTPRGREPGGIRVRTRCLSVSRAATRGWDEGGGRSATPGRAWPNGIRAAAGEVLVVRVTNALGERAELVCPQPGGAGHAEAGARGRL